MGKDKKEGEAVFLRKKITLLRAFSLLIGSMVGSGIFISPKGVLKNSGSVGFSLVVWFACGVLSMFGALCYAELGTRITKSGGHYIYILETLGPLPSFLFLWAEFFAIRPANSAVVSLAFGRYMLEPFFAPCAAPVPAVKLVSLLGYYAAFSTVSLEQRVLLYFFLCVFNMGYSCSSVVSSPDTVLTLNSWSVTWSARLQTALSIVKLLALALIIVPGMMLLAQGHTENFQDAFDRESLVLDKLPLAFYAGMFAYSGWFQTSFVREELVRPERNIPLAVIVSVITVIVGYMLTNVSYYTVLGTQDVLASPAVAVSFVQQAFKSLISVVPVLVALSCFGTMNGGIFTFSRTLFVASREGQWPPLFSMIHIRRHTPLPAVMLMFPLVTAMVCIGDIYHLMNFFSFSRWLFIGLATLGLIVHRHRHPELRSPFKVPLFIPISFTIICLFTVAMSFYSDPVNISIGCTMVLSGFPVYYLIIHRQMSSRCRSPFYYLTHKLQLLLEVVQQEIKTY
ncbi:cystine/glutamate transporter isoform X1 [Balearica regulorum gibbericeps]|uniref:cystine/glutamate transporter isoform X1 n=1 Tax=Balearica regulorum gibbericeps TaxID=100784 RepID=UPI003F5DD86E